MPFVNFRKKFRFFSFDFRQISMFAVTEHRRNQTFLKSYPFFFKIFTLVLLDGFLDGF